MQQIQSQLSQLNVQRISRELSVVLNQTNTPVFAIAFVVLLFLTTGFFTLLLSFILALLITWGLRNYVFNHRQTREAVGNASVLVTGCSSGIGEKLTIKLNQLGFVVFAGVRKEDDGKELLKKCSNPKNVIPLILDVTNKDDIDKSRQIVKNYLKDSNSYLYAVINNAGYSEASCLELVPAEKLRKQFEVNVIGQVYVSNAFLPLLRQPSPAAVSNSKRLIFISSGVGKITFAGTVPYCATKHALESIGDGYRMELKKWKIDVSLIEPGSFATGFSNTVTKNRGDNMEEAKKTSYVANEERDVFDFYQAATVRAQEQKLPRDDVTKVIDVIEQALLDSSPLTRYRVGNDAVFGLPILLSLPDRVRDMVLGKAFNS